MIWGELPVKGKMDKFPWLQPLAASVKALDAYFDVYLDVYLDVYQGSIREAEPA